MQVSELITIDPEILGGTPVFKGTRVPVKTLFEYLEDNYTLDQFLECFPTVNRDLARKVLERSRLDYTAERDTILPEWNAAELLLRLNKIDQD